MEKGYNIIHKIHKEAKQLAKAKAYNEIEEAKLIAKHIFEYIGGKLDEARIEAEIKAEQDKNIETYRNTCATKLSFAFNNSEIKIDHKNLKLVGGTKWKGKDGFYYYTGVSGIKNLLIENWKKKGLKPFSQNNKEDFYKVFYNYKQEPYSTLVDSYTNIINAKRVKEIRNNNEKFFKTLQGLNKKGIVTMDIDACNDARGHTTLWNGSDFVDDENYLNDEREHIFVRELCFFELK
ncbi:hypothetical protein DMC01_07915 [Campylobacter troglodytis]|nr:hypothetical protein DMC01_07915 [Campylobacter troglodytis]